MDVSPILAWAKAHDFVLSLLIAVALTAIALSFPTAVAARVVLWSVVWLFVVHLLFISIRTELPVKLLGAAGLTLLLAAGTYIPVKEAYRRERAATLTGYVRAYTQTPRPSLPQLEVGDSSTVFIWAGPGNQPFMQILYDAGLRIETTSRGIEISTPVRDRFGHLIAEIDRNHWSVSPDRSASSDKNYTGDTLEVLDGGGHVVLQVRVLADRVQLQGEWRDQFGNGVQIMKSPDPTHPGAIMGIWRNPQMEQRILQLIPRMFKYPSSKHWGELVDNAR